MWARLLAWLLSLLCVGLLVHQYHLSENKAQQEEIMHLRVTTVKFQMENQQLQKEKQQLQEENQQLQEEKQYLRQEKQQLQEEKQQLQKENQQHQEEKQYLRQEKQQLQKENQQLQEEKQQVQKENQYLRDSSTWNKIVFCVTTANGITSIVAGIASGTFSPTSVYQAAINIFYQIFGIESSTSMPMIGFNKDPKLEYD